MGWLSVCLLRSISKHRRPQVGWLQMCLCGLFRETGDHKWDACKCIYCGAFRKTAEHKWDGCKCSYCDVLRDIWHQWSGCVCTQCHKTRVWEACKCASCTKIRVELGKRQAELAMTCDRCQQCNGFRPLVHDIYGDCPYSRICSACAVQITKSYEDSQCGNDCDYSCPKCGKRLLWKL